MKNVLLLGQHLIGLRNYFSGITLAVTLQNSAIGRLKKHWEGVKNNSTCNKIYKELADLVECSRNAKNIRAIHDKAAPPCVPWIGIFQKDIEFALQYPVRVDKQINLQQAKILSDILGKFEYLQNGNYTFKKDPKIHAYLASREYLTDADYYELSCEIEPRQ